MLKKALALKYRPKQLKDYIFQNDNQKLIIEKYIKEQNLPNLIFYGYKGIGKTSLAHLLVKELNIEDVDFLMIDASTDNSIDNIRNRIIPFISSISSGLFKIVLLDEADYLSTNAQATLRGILENEQYTTNARFILTCNYIKKIEPAVRSRCQEFEFKSLDKEIILQKFAEILTIEKVKIGKNGKDVELLEKYINLAYPDFRKLLTMAEQNTVDGQLIDPITKDTSLEYKLELIDLLDIGNWEKIRQIVCENVDGDEWIELYKFLYENLNEIPRFKDILKYKKAILIIAEYLYRHSLIADPEINFTACIIKLLEI